MVKVETCDQEIRVRFPTQAVQKSHSASSQRVVEFDEHGYRVQLVYYGFLCIEDMAMSYELMVA